MRKLSSSLLRDGSSAETIWARAYWQPLSLCRWPPHPLWVWHYVKRTTVRGRGQSQSPTTPLHPKPPEKKAVIYFAVTRTERDHVIHSGGTLIMLSEEDGRMLSPSAVTARHAGIEPRWARLSPATQILCPRFFLTDPWEEENGRARGAELLSEKKANHVRREARLKHSQRVQSAPLCAVSALDFPKRDTLSVSVISVQGIPARLTMTAWHLQQRMRWNLLF